MSELSNLLVALEGTDFYTIVLPFLLVFAIVYGALLAVDIFDNNPVNAIIALVVALFFIQEEALYGNVSNFLAGIMGPYAIFLVLGVLLVIPLAIGGMGPGDFDIKGYPVIAIALLLGVALIIWQQGGFNRVFGDVFDVPALPELAGVDVFTLGIILVTAGAFYWMISSGGGGGG